MNCEHHQKEACYFRSLINQENLKIIDIGKFVRWGVWGLFCLDFAISAFVWSSVKRLFHFSEKMTFTSHQARREHRKTASKQERKQESKLFIGWYKLGLWAGIKVMWAYSAIEYALKAWPLKLWLFEALPSNIFLTTGVKLMQTDDTRNNWNKALWLLGPTSSPCLKSILRKPI